MVTWFKQNAEFVTLMALSWHSSRHVYVYCANGFWFGFHHGDLCFGSSGCISHGTVFSLLFSNVSKLFCLVYCLGLGVRFTV